MLHTTIGIISCLFRFVNFFISRCLVTHITDGFFCCFFSFHHHFCNPYFTFFTILKFIRNILLIFLFTITYQCQNDKYWNTYTRCNYDDIWYPVITTSNLHKISSKKLSFQTVHKRKTTGWENTSQNIQ